MTDLHVPVTVCTVRLITLVLLLICKQTTTCGAIFLLFKHCFSSQLICLMLVKTRPTPEISIAQLAWDSNMGKRAWRNWHTITTRLFAFMCHVTTTSFITSFKHISFSHRTCNINNHMIMACYVIIKNVNPFSFWTCPSNIMSSQFKHENTKILYSLKYSWSRVSSLIPPPRCKLMTVVSSNRWTTVTIFRPSRYDL